MVFGQTYQLKRTFNKSKSINEDLVLINNNESSLKELQDIILILNQETKKYYNYDILQSKELLNKLSLKRY